MVRKKKPALRRTVRDLLSTISQYRLLLCAIFLLITSVVASQSAGTYHSATAGRPELIAKPSSGHSSQTTRAPDNSPKSAGPLLMPWRGPVEPLPGTANAAPVIYEIPTADPVVFVTIDDGLIHNPAIADWLTTRRLPFSLFLDNDAIKNNYPYFARLKSTGMTIQNHTLSHPFLPKMPLEGQRAEICGAADTFAAVYGKRPTLFRPPYGAFSDATRQAAAECGMRAIVMWRAVVENGAVHFQDPKVHLESGDIVLMHFTSNLISDMEALAAQALKDHLKVGRLEDWLK